MSVGIIVVCLRKQTIAMGVLRKKSMIIIDMNSGRYVESLTGHECHNLEKNKSDGRYYGYCPPHDSIDITRLGAKRTDESIDDVIVVYVTSLHKKSDKVILAFTDSATVHRHGIDGKSLKRKIDDNGKIDFATYTIESDNLYNLTTFFPKLVFNSYLDGKNILRGQRTFKGMHPKIDNLILDYLEDYLDGFDTLDDAKYQNEIQNYESARKGQLKNTSDDEPECDVAGGSMAVRKRVAVAKQALQEAGFECAADASHKTFNTGKGVQYMEGHHLIPCTAGNAQHFWKEYQKNIDCVENIVCLCPTCHRKIHYGSVDEKREIIRQLYRIQKGKLKAAGINITDEELIGLYI